ncbi:hypothetical protein PPL_01877 [Heterostelium album PN500]|uniref:Ankyrin repeat protein n=1 Tax=Heterostelium pallidum (strain ATCC 26659 / Pp 5 / PN500) TaxID=670386 RepID=D3B0R0_HETP5|nr:hypothetical protein PPL_01877 [Heterostelium album PN500]EFA84884.1 hypothetical protein PPL_01877 [Heterostelium album PN500]|eukprot:XP_020436995.1 hypothetical protein PPL_01877 [Heterostelium album PN500]
MNQFSIILKSTYIRRIIFRHIKLINSEIAPGYLYGWDQLIYFPVQLIRYGYYDLLAQSLTELFDDLTESSPVYKSAVEYLVETIVELSGTDQTSLLIEIMAKYAKFIQSSNFSDVIRTSSRRGKLDNLIYFYNNWSSIFLMIDHSVPIGEAAANGHTDVVKYLFSKKLYKKGDTKAIDGAAQSGSLELVRFLHDTNEFKCSVRAMDEAAKGGFLQVVQFLFKNRTEMCSVNAMNGAAKNGHLGVLRFLHGHLSTSICGVEAMESAAENGHLDCVRFLHEHRKEGARNALSNAALNGHFEVVKFLIENRTEQQSNDTTVFDNSVTTGNLELVKYLHERTTVCCTTEAMDRSSRHGHFELVKFLNQHRSEGCTVSAIDGAAIRGHLEIVDFLFNNRTEGCSDNLFDSVCFHGKLDVLKYLHAKRMNCTVSAMNYAAMSNQLEIVKFLQENRSEGCNSVALEHAAGSGFLDMIESLYWYQPENLTSLSISHSVASGQLSVVKFLLLVGSHLFIGDEIKTAAAYGHLSIVKYLFDNQLIHREIIDQTLKQAIVEGKTKIKNYLIEAIKSKWD